MTEFRWHNFTPFPLTQPPLAPVHPPLIWWWLGQARAWAWMWIAMGCETDSQSRLECLSPAWSSLQEGTKGALQGSAGWISSKEPMAGAAGWLAGRRPAGAPAVGHSTGRGRTGAHTANPPQAQYSSSYSPNPPISAHRLLKFSTKVKGEPPWRRWRDEIQWQRRMMEMWLRLKCPPNMSLKIWTWQYWSSWLKSLEL